MAFNLNKYEYNCYHHNFEEAARQFIGFLRDLDGDLGKLTEKFTANVPVLALNDQLTEHFLSRIISATTYLFLHKNFTISDHGFSQMIYLQRWVEMMFAASPFRNADHIIQAFNQSEDANNPVIGGENLAKFAMFYLPDSNVPLNFEGLWQVNRHLTCQLCFALLSPRLLGTQAAHDKRELLLQWLPEKLYELDSLDSVPVSILHDVYMHCSYADTPKRHDIKKPLNRLMRLQLEKAGIGDVPNLPTEVKEGEKPVLLVLLEWFSGGHSIWRTHSRCIDEARKEFHVIGMGLENRVGKETHGVFDEYIPIKDNIPLFEQVKFVRDVAEQCGAHVFYMPSIGMFLNSIFMTCLRIAPVQMVALGHPATTNSPYIDYVVVEDIYVGEDTPKCFSEELMRLPKDIFYRPSMFAQDLDLNTKREFDPEVVNIVMAATIMKFNPKLLQTLKQILDKSKKKIHFHFLIGQAIGLTHMHIKNIIQQALGKDNVTVHEHKGYKEYMNIMSKCDMFLNPFPFGNTNGIVDTITAGLPGICKTGPEVFEHIDDGLFHYLGFPEWTVAKTTEEYVEAALRMIENPLERLNIAQQFSGKDKVEKFFQGDASCMGRMMRERLDKALAKNKPQVEEKAPAKATKAKATKAKTTKAKAEKTTKKSKK
ncbi:hypothetical protein CJP74_04890 [Psittacicella melopsittaci]|uniref:Uncharacterized protein n=1 Tax=Psittacicella melopsittaci TaxID=2028576 RepID=A0A3A1Y444_9GAMM|nr:peptide transporter [Psittacicella melopsittaci]RIY32335.1 hypothetical protein CJP74_04890 [Psittacicella melopsittaci]